MTSDDRQDQDPLEPVIEAILDGQPVEWPRDHAADLEPDDRALLEPLRVLAAIAAIHDANRPEGTGETGRRFELGELIGRGASGAVYRAWDSRLHREVALKVLRLDQPFAASVLSEARRLARVRHPNIVTIHDVFESRDEGRICMELLSGLTLDRIVQDRGPLAGDAVVGLARTLCDALTVIHASGLVHGDVKAHNVFVEDSGRIVLMDFGAGVEIRSPSSAIREGTPLYMAPELFDGGRPQPESDIYSLGVLLFYAATGRYPVSGRSLREIRESVRTREAADAARRELPRPLGAWVARSLAADPRERFTSGEAMKESLRPAASRSHYPLLAVLCALVVLLCAAAWTSRPAGGGQMQAPRGSVTREIVMPEHFMGVGDLSEDGKSLAFVDSSGGVNVLDISSGASRPLVPGTKARRAQDSALMRHRFGTVVYASRDETCACTDLFEVPVSGGTPHRLRLRDGFAELMPTTLSRDGTQLLVRVPDGLGTGEMRIVDLATGDSRSVMRIPHNMQGVQLSPDGRFIAFDKPAGENGAAADLYVVDAATGEEWPLLKAGADDSMPLWASDESIVFSSDRAGGHGLWQIAVENGRAVSAPVLVQRDMGRFIPVRLSAGGGLIYWRSPVIDIELAPFDPDTGTIIGSSRLPPMRVTGSNTAPSWSPDGGAFAYSSERKPYGPVRSVLVIHRLADSREQEIHVQVNGPLEPVWSPDGRHLLIRGPGTADNVRGARLVDIASARVTAVFPYPLAAGPQWAPDGKAYYFLTAGGILQKVDVTSGEVSAVPVDGGWKLANIALSPDGTQIAASAWSGGKPAVILVGTAGGPPRVVHSDGRPEAAPLVWAWTPDGLHLLGVRRIEPQEAARGQLVTIRLADGALMEAGLERPALAWVRVRPDGREIAYRTGRDVRSLWLMEHFLPAGPAGP